MLRNYGRDTHNNCYILRGEMASRVNARALQFLANSNGN